MERDEFTNSLQSAEADSFLIYLIPPTALKSNLEKIKADKQSEVNLSSLALKLICFHSAAITDDERHQTRRTRGTTD